jgi:ADP-ribose pyrophosphatase YjhB (NUDIX family)
LPGGGVDPGESPQDAVLREVAEESGQRVRLVGVLGVVDGHWVGRAPDGRLEDFHAVRLVWQAVCDDPTDPVVHDVGGTTAAAAWVPIEHVASLPLSDAWRGVLIDLTAPTTDGAGGSAHQT